MGAQIYRYRRFLTGAQRQQAKWVIFGLGTAIIGVLRLGLFDGLFSFARLGPLGTLIAIAMIYGPLAPRARPEPAFD